MKTSMKTKTTERKRAMKKTAMTCITPRRVSKRGRINGSLTPLLTARQFRAGATAYFAFCEARMKNIEDDDGKLKSIPWPEIPTKEGLSDYISTVSGCHVDRHEIGRWLKGEGQGKDDPELCEAVKRAYGRIDAAVMRHVLDSKTPAGGIFYAKAALGYRDIQSVETSGPDGGPIQSQGSVIFEFCNTTVQDDPDPVKLIADGTERKPTDAECVERR